MSGGGGRWGHLSVNSPLGVLFRTLWRPTQKRRPSRNSPSFALTQNCASKRTIIPDISRVRACVRVCAWLCFVFIIKNIRHRPSRPLGHLGVVLMDEASSHLRCGHGNCPWPGNEGAIGHPQGRWTTFPLGRVPKDTGVGVLLEGPKPSCAGFSCSETQQRAKKKFKCWACV